MERLVGLKPRFFEGLAAKDIAAIVKRVTEIRYRAGAVMVHEGHVADQFFLLLRGRARGFATGPGGDKVQILPYRPGEIFGAAALLDETAVYPLSTEAVEDSAALVWDHATIRELGERYPLLVRNALAIALDYVVIFRGRYVSATCKTASQRVAQVLGNLARDMGKKVDDGIELDITNDELAREAGISLYSASRLVNKRQRAGFLTRRGQKIVIHSPGGLPERDF